VSHARGECCREATHAAPTAVKPIATPPQPGTAVNSAARSIVSRMYRRWSAARASIGMGSDFAERRGLTKAMVGKIAGTADCVKYFTSQSWPRSQSAARATVAASFRGYRPISAFHRIRKTSVNICTLSRHMLTFVAGECAQRTGISIDRKP